MKSKLIQSIHDCVREYTPSEQKQIELKQLFLTYQHDQFCRKSHTEPGHFTASGFVRTEDFEYICLVFHPRFQKWIQPGGHLEITDREIQTAAKREVFEETGLNTLTWDGTIRLDVHRVPQTNKLNEHLHFDLQFGFVSLYQPLQGDVRAEWVKWDTFDRNLSDDSVQQFLENWK